MARSKGEQANADFKDQLNPQPWLAALRSGGHVICFRHAQTDRLFEAATGIYPDPQGMAYVLTPHGSGGFTAQANRLPNEWAKLSISGLRPKGGDWPAHHQGDHATAPTGAEQRRVNR